MELTKAIVIDSKRHHVKLSIGEWKFGPCVDIEVFCGSSIYFRSKALCSPESKEYNRVSLLDPKELLEEAWLLFKKKYPFERLKETIRYGLTVFVYWELKKSLSQ
ncbi:hypothetical protein [Pleionea sediminis]|uniref:hypothetical protein n=1 Tax=Pleionea sediminis TaxID=2569479 RepID=UPI0011858AC6|nr:hypothetical protein [Pleionea sediminis]